MEKTTDLSQGKLDDIKWRYVHPTTGGKENKTLVIIAIGTDCIGWWNFNYMYHMITATDPAIVNAKLYHQPIAHLPTE